MAGLTDQRFVLDQIDELETHFNRVGGWSIANIEFAIREPYYGVHGDRTMHKPHRTAIREVAEVLCRAVWAPQMNPPWSGESSTKIFAQELFQTCNTARAFFEYGEKRAPDIGLDIYDFPWVLILNEVVGRALGFTD